MNDKAKPIGFISDRGVGILAGADPARRATVSPIRYGDMSIPVYLEPRPAPDDQAALLLVAIDLLKGSKAGKDWVAEARKVLRVASAAKEVV